MNVTHATQAPPVSGSEVSSDHRSPAPKTHATSPSTDTVRISHSAVEAAKAASQERTDTKAEPERGARAGNHPAKRLMAKYSSR